MAIGLALFMMSSAGAVVAQDVPLMTKETLKKILTDKDVLVLDARRGRDWSGSEFKIKGAVRGAPDEVDSWSTGFDKSKKVVVYCA